METYSEVMRMRVAERLVVSCIASGREAVLNTLRQIAHASVPDQGASQILIADAATTRTLRSEVSPRELRKVWKAATVARVLMLCQGTPAEIADWQVKGIDFVVKGWNQEGELLALLADFAEGNGVVGVLAAESSEMLRAADRAFGTAFSWGIGAQEKDTSVDVGGVRYVFRGAGSVAVGGDLQSEAAIVADSVHGASVRGIARRAWVASMLKTLFIPAPVTAIGTNAFSDCKHLRSIVLPTTLRYIGPGAFESCSSLTSVDLPEGLTNIDAAAFAQCSSLTRVLLPRTIVELDRSVFDHCDPDLTLIVFSGSYAHRWALDSGIRYRLADDVTVKATAPKAGFYAEMLDDDSWAILRPPATASEQVALEVPAYIDGKRVSMIGADAFRGLRKLVSVRLPESIERVLPGAFRECPNLREIQGLGEKTMLDPQAFDPEFDLSSLPAISADDLSSRIRLTPRMICALLERALPQDLTDLADVPVSGISGGLQSLQPDCVYTIRVRGRRAQQAARTAWSGRKIRFFIATEQLTDERGRNLPTLIHEKPSQAFLELMEWIKARYSATTIAITGSVGKTTTKEMVGAVAALRGTTVMNRANLNGALWVGAYVQQLRHHTEVYVQESGAQFPGSVERSARILRPDAFVITNIGLSHVENYGSVESTLHEKLSLDRYLSPGGAAFVNFDDERLRLTEYQGRVVSFGVHSRDVDYFAENLRELEGTISFEVVESSSGNRTRVELSAIGEHNAYNGVAAFAVGRWLGVAGLDIARALAAYRSVGLRQNLMEIDGRPVYVDCYNASRESIAASVRAFQRIKVAEKARRVYVVGDILELGTVAEEVHRDVGRDLGEQEGVDLFICYGEQSAALAEELLKAGKTALHTTERSELIMFLHEHLGPQDAIAFKASNGMNLGGVVDELFGTRFAPK